MRKPSVQNTGTPVQDDRIRLIDSRIEREGRRPESLIEVLHTVQNAYGHLPMNVLEHVSEELGLPPSRVYSVATFYHFFSLVPQGAHRCVVCTGTACYIKGARGMLSVVEREFGIRSGQVTPDGVLGLGEARCVGACGMAPVALVDGNMMGDLQPEVLIAALKAKTTSK